MVCWSLGFFWPAPPHSNHFTLWSFVSTIGNINFCSHTNTLSILLSFSKSQAASFTTASILGRLTVVVFFFPSNCGRMLSWLAGEDSVSQVAVGRQICWSQTGWHTWVTVALLRGIPPYGIPTRTRTAWHSDLHPQKHLMDMKHHGTGHKQTNQFTKYVLYTFYYLSTDFPHV